MALKSVFPLLSVKPSVAVPAALAFAAVCISLLSASQFCSPADAAEGPAKKTVQTPAKGLHRLDFILAHASCPSCILKVRKALRETSGVEKCEIALRKPYGGALVYAPGKVTIDKLQAIATKADPNKVVEMTELLEKPVDAVPELLVPSYMFKK